MRIPHRTLIQRFLISTGVILAGGCTRVVPVLPAGPGPQPVRITAAEIRSHVKYLASDTLEGRFPGSAGSRLALEYIENQWRQDRIQPAGDNGTYRQNFEFVSGITLGDSNSLSLNDTALAAGRDYLPLGFSAVGTLEAGVVFAGYGFSLDDSISWDDYAGLTVTGSWVAILRDGPDSTSPQIALEEHHPLRRKVLMAQDRGAAGVLVISRLDDHPEELIPLHVDYELVGAGIPVVHISRAVAARLLTPAGQNLRALQDSLDNRQKPYSFVIPDLSVSARVDLRRQTIRIPNLVGLIPGFDPVLKDEYVVLGAHADHLGYGGPGSNSQVPEVRAIHNGADDNASGVAALLEIGQQLSAERQRLSRSVLLLVFNAEEKGTLGSRYFVKHPVVDLKQIVLMINMDMLGRLRDSTLTIGGTGTAADLDSVLKAINRGHSLRLKTNASGFGPSDQAPFYASDIPVLFFFTGSHTDYHTPEDDWEKINAAGERAVAAFIYETLLTYARPRPRPQFVKAGPTEAPARRSFKVTLGVIPGYGSETPGLELEGVKAGGPAERAGLQKGDIIIAIDGREVGNIYDYMYRLAELKPGQTVPVTVRRGTEIIVFPVQL